MSLVQLPAAAWAARPAPGSPPGAAPATADRGGASTALHAAPPAGAHAVARTRPAAAPAPPSLPFDESAPVAGPVREGLAGAATPSIAGADAVTGADAAPRTDALPAASGVTGGVSTAIEASGPGRSGSPSARPGPGRPSDLTAVRRGVSRTLRYPDEARRARLHGRVEVEFVLLADGRVRKTAVRASSGHRILDGAAVSAIEEAAPFDPPGTDVVVVLPVSFRGD